MQQFQDFIATELFHAITGTVLWTVFVALVLALPAPYIAFKLIRRNRCLGGNIYNGLAQADRFMQIWIAGEPLASVDEQYIWAFVPNRNPLAAHNSKIDKELERHRLVRVFEKRDRETGEIAVLAEPRIDLYFGFRNSCIFLFLLFLRVVFFGDSFSHIAIGNGIYNVRKLRRLFIETSFLISLIFVGLGIFIFKKLS